jgi:hypothetical protein
MSAALAACTDGMALLSLHRLIERRRIEIEAGSVGSDGEFMPACEHHFQPVPFDASPMWRRGELSECCVVVARKGAGHDVYADIMCTYPR